MAAAQRKPNYVSVPNGGSTVLRRVIRRETAFICGICRSQYPDSGEANSCLESCWKDILQGSLVVWRQRGIARHPGCKLCKREYQTAAQAQECGDACKSKFVVTLYSVDGGTPPRPIPRRKRLQAAAVAPPVHVLLLDETPATPEAKAAAVEAPPANAAETSSPASVAATTADPPDAPEAPQKKPKDHTKKFFRDGARYVCNECQAKFFTKSEVEKCWDAH